MRQALGLARLGGDWLFAAVLGRCQLRDLLEDPAEVGNVTVSAIGRNFLEGHRVIAQHEFGAIHPHEIHIVIEAHQSFMAEETRNVVGSQPKMFGHRLPCDGTLKILLHIEADRLIGADGLPWRMSLRGLQQPQTGMKQ